MDPATSLVEDEEAVGLTAKDVLTGILEGTEVGANFPLWVVDRYATKHGAPDSLREDMAQTAILATVRALETYDSARGSLLSWVRLLIEQDLSKLLRAEREGRRIAADHDTLTAVGQAEASAERDVFEGWRRRVVLEAVKQLPERQAQAVALWYRLDGWPHKRTDADVGDAMYETARAAEGLRRRGVEGLRAMGLPRELLDESEPDTWPPPSKRASHRQARPTRARGLNGPVIVRHDPSIIRPEKVGRSTADSRGSAATSR